MKKLLIKILSRKKKQKLEKINSILIETPWHYGDCIMNSYLLEALYFMNPNIKIDIFVREHAIEIFKFFPYINLIFPYRSSKNKIKRYFDRIKMAINNRGKYDVIISYEDGVNTFHLLWLKLLKASYIMTHPLKNKYNFDIKMIDEYFIDNQELLKKFKISNYTKSYKIYLGKYEEIALNYYDSNKKNIIFNYIGSQKNRILESEEIKKILERINEENINIYITSTPLKYEETMKIVDEISKENIKLLPKTETIFELISYVKYCDIVISVDTSLIHIASMYNKPILGFYTADRENQKRYLPISEKYYIVNSKYEDRIKDLNLEEVESRIKKLLFDKKD